MTKYEGYVNVGRIEYKKDSRFYKEVYKNSEGDLFMSTYSGEYKLYPILIKESSLLSWEEDDSLFCRYVKY